jgi:hypothetical protein
MMGRATGFGWLVLAVFGFQTFVATSGDESRAEAAGPPASLTLSPATANHLTLAAAQLEKGDEAGACVHLAQYLAAHPEHTAIRVHFAELLLRQRRTEAAREQFEIFAVESQEQRGIPLNQRIRCESRLANIAEQEEDEYAECLHRGIGLYLLASSQLAAADSEASLTAESILFRAARELRQAHELRPGEARPSWYLYQVWTSLAQRQPALRRLKAAETAAAFTYLTPAERRDLQLAWARAGKNRNP